MTSSMNSLPIGADIYTVNGDKLGEVKEIRDRYFKVDASGQPDYWLANDCIRGGYMSGNRVTVDFDKSRLDEHKVKLND